MKFSKKLTTLLACSLFVLPIVVVAEELESPNYKITGLTVDSGGDAMESASYKAFTTAGQSYNTDRLSSASYKLGSGTANVWMANVPIIDCAGAQDGDASECVSMATLCGYTGCYDRAYFEIDPQGNPTDTLYNIQIKRTADSTWSYVDSATFTLESVGTRDITDFELESYWEGVDFNILGLDPATEYQIRATALHGDDTDQNYTESGLSPVVTFETATSEIFFDIDIGPNSSANTASPYNIDLGAISPVGPVTTAPNQIWLDIETNAPNGMEVFVHDLNSGLESTDAAYTIASSDTNLASASEGYGIQISSVSDSGDPLIGTLTKVVPFDGSAENVGGLDTIPDTILNTANEAINDGRAGIYVKAKAQETTPVADDYSDTITFTAAGTF